MSDLSDFPIIQCQPGPTDAELAADRDAKHADEVMEWNAHQDWLDHLDLDHIPARAVHG